MGVGFKNRLSAGATVVSNAFIDQFMAGASGEYVKVYLYLLRHQQEEISVELVAEALNHTEADVRRALAYWQKAGVLGGTEQAEARKPEIPVSAGRVENPVSAGRAESPVSAGRAENPVSTGRADRPETGGSHGGAACDMAALASDEAFRQLVYIAEQYLGKVLTQTDCQILGNLYAGLGFSEELLEYLIEYCVQNHHTSLRYIEKVALSWHEKKIRTVEEARTYSRGFSREAFAVMKAMGLTGRSPADSEYALMEKWFREYGFTREIVVEACSRTIRAIHTPSFQYADRILSDWKKAGVRAFRDVAALDKARQAEAEQRKSGAGISGRQNAGKAFDKKGVSRGTNRFHNLEEHGYDYDKMVWSMMNAEQEADRGENTEADRGRE